ncbi:hypothetical protein [Ekhidna sp.]
MKKFKLLLIVLFFGSSSSTEHQLIGSWKQCNIRGEYIEHRFFDDYVLYATEGYWSPTTFPIEVQDDTFKIRSLGRIQKFKIVPLSEDSLMLRNDQDTILLLRLTEEIPIVDSLNLDKWLETYEADFRRRSSEWTECVQVPMPELLDLGEVDDDFEDIVVPDLSELDSTYVQ